MFENICDYLTDRQTDRAFWLLGICSTVEEKVVSVSIQKSNSNVIMRKMRKLSEARKEGWDDTEVNIQNYIH